MIKIPDLDYANALKFCKEVQDYKCNIGGITVDFSHVKNCDPFPMLLVSYAIRSMRLKNLEYKFNASNCNNGYAEYMRFYRACGVDLGDDTSYVKYKNTYICITKWDIRELQEESRKNLEYIQETIENRAKSMAKILAQNNVEFANWLVFVLREIIRNIPEHSDADAIWYCAQYWPSYDLVELAILDEGRGIYESLKSNSEYYSLIQTDYDALKLAIQPGISRTFGSRGSINNEWKNSGFGLYMVSQLCTELSGSFIIASGNGAIRLKKTNGITSEERFGTHINGTAIQIRIRPSEIGNYRQISREILNRGERMVQDSDKSIKSASKSSKSIIFDDNPFL